MVRKTLAVAASLVGFSPALTQTPPPAPPPACAGPEHSQFDFWVGRWEVFRTANNQRAATSLIEKLYGGCVIRENWMPLKGNPGGSLNHFDTEQKRWRQVWVDSTNARVEFDGGFINGKMILTGHWQDVDGPGKHGLVRMTYSTLADGSVRQFGEMSTDHGLSWSPAFDFTYRREKGR